MLTKVEISIPCGIFFMQGQLQIPVAAKSLVLFSHGSGSNRFSKRNRVVADLLNRSALATLLFDLLSEHEDEVYSNRFNIDLLTKRLVMAVEFMQEFELTSGMDIGLFGASTGAASALNTSVRFPGIVNAIVSRGGRVDLSTCIDEVSAATLLIVGENDTDVVEMNLNVFRRLKCEKEMTLVKGATHLFEEPGALKQVGELSANWFTRHLGDNSGDK